MNPAAVPVALLSRSETHTRQLGAALGALWRAADPALPQLIVVSLGGDLGAGKTHISKGIVRGLGGDEHEVVSPTFTLMAVYPLPEIPGAPTIEVHHFDCYRLADAADAMDVGLEQSLAEPAADQRRIVLIEWGSRVPGLLPAVGDVRSLELAHGDHDSSPELRRVVARGFTRAERDALLRAAEPAS